MTIPVTLRNGGILVTCSLLAVALLALVAPVSAQTNVSVSGTVTIEEGDPVVGADVEFDSGGSTVASDVTDSAGRYAVSLDAGTYNVTVTPPDSSDLLRQTQSGFVVDEGGTLDVVIVAINGPAVYAGRLLDSTGTPIAGAGVSLSDGSFYYPRFRALPAYGH